MNESVSCLRYDFLPVLADRDRLSITVSWIQGCQACRDPNGFPHTLSPRIARIEFRYPRWLDLPRSGAESWGCDGVAAACQGGDAHAALATELTIFIERDLDGRSEGPSGPDLRGRMLKKVMVQSSQTGRP